jgi:hypothetical protein
MRTNNHTMKAITLYLGLDVHKDSITIAIAEPGSKGEIRPFGTITRDIDRLEKALGRIRKAHPGAQLEVACEAGPCGFVIARRLKQLGVPAERIGWFTFPGPDCSVTFLFRLIPLTTPPTSMRNPAINN